MEKTLNKRLFLSGVVVRFCRVKPKVRGSSPTQYLSFFLFFPSFFIFFRFCFVLFASSFCCFSINTSLNNCYLMKCKKRQEKYQYNTIQ